MSDPLEVAATMRVVDVWDSMEHFETFGQRLLPLIAKVGGEATPEIAEAHHFQTD